MVDIIILANGLGQRYKDESFLFPKPLVNIYGRPIIFYIIDELLNIDFDYNLHVVYNKRLDHFEFKETLQHNYKSKIKINFLSLDNTSGPCETVYKGLDLIGTENPFLTIDCDILFDKQDIDDFVIKKQNVVYFFEDKEKTPQFSYITHDDGKVLNIKEKIKISDYACCGIYGYESTKIFKENYNEAKYLIHDREICPSDIYSNIIKKGLNVNCIKSKNYNCLGTPQLLKKYYKKENISKKYRFCFDVDNTLIKLNINKDYSNEKPINRIVELIKKLHSSGHQIILYTARNMATYQNNIGLINKNTAPNLIETLNRLEIPFDEVYFGKPIADFYIDDKAINVFDDIEKFTGFYINENS